MLTHRNHLVRSLRPYVDPADVDPARGAAGRVGGRALQQWLRRGLEPYER